MNHKVNSVADLYSSAVALYNNAVVGSAETSAATILGNLNEGIKILKRSWQGIDAGKQINNVVTVYNAFVKVKNSLEELSVETSKIASDYRAIQRANGAQLEELSKIVASAPEMLMEEYTDIRDMVNITPEAVNGKIRVEAANNAIDRFISLIGRYFNEIMDNWTAGPHREEANQAFDEFVAGSTNYKNLLNEVSQSVSSALQNYGM